MNVLFLANKYFSRYRSRSRSRSKHFCVALKSHFKNYLRTSFKFVEKHFIVKPKVAWADTCKFTLMLKSHDIHLNSTAHQLFNFYPYQCLVAVAGVELHVDLAIDASFTLLVEVLTALAFAAGRHFGVLFGSV